MARGDKRYAFFIRLGVKPTGECEDLSLLRKAYEFLDPHLNKTYGVMQNGILVPVVENDIGKLVVSSGLNIDPHVDDLARNHIPQVITMQQYYEELGRVDKIFLHPGQCFSVNPKDLTHISDQLELHYQSRDLAAQSRAKIARAA